MIHWKKAPKYVPQIDTEDAFNKENGISKRVVVGFVSTSTKSKHYSFGRYYHQTKHWVFEGYTGGDYKAICWAGWTEPNVMKSAFDEDENNEATFIALDE
jgi:hypothetical protein